MIPHRAAVYIADGGAGGTRRRRYVDIAEQWRARRLLWATCYSADYTAIVRGIARNHADSRDE